MPHLEAARRPCERAEGPAQTRPDAMSCSKLETGQFSDVFCAETVDGRHARY